MPASDEVLVALGVTLRGLDAAAERKPDAGVLALGRTWQRELDAAVTRWQAEVSPAQEASALNQVESGVHENDPSLLAGIMVPDLGAGALLAGAMRTMAAAGAAAVVAEAAAAGATVTPPPPAAVITLAEWARAAADLLAAGLALGVGREALRLWRPGATAADVTSGVRAYLLGLTDRSLRDVIGGALTRAQNLGRLETYRRGATGWTVQLVADETLDANTCRPCRDIDDTVLPSLDAAGLAYGGAGYLFCKGGERCRGTVRGQWVRDEDEATASWARQRAAFMALDQPGTQ